MAASPSAPIAGDASASSALMNSMGGAAVPGAGMDAAQAQVQALIVDLRGVDQKVQQVAANNPELAPVLSQISTLLKQAIVMKAQAMQAQTASGLAVPGGGMAGGQ